MWAEALIQFELPLTKYWLPLAIGLGVGAMCIVLGRHMSSGKPPAPPTPPPPTPKEYYDPFALGSPTNLRKGPRRGGRPIEILYARPESISSPTKGWVVDRSVGGLCLWLAEEIAVGTIISVLPVNASSVTPWTDMEVCHCEAEDNAFEIGCKFVKTPPSLILMQFG